MKKYQIHFNDWQRILFGEVPATFYIELIIRALLVYLLLMMSMRAMGKRMSAQLSRNELAALVSLAAAVGVPMMAPNRGILPAVVIALVVIGVQRLIAMRAVQSQNFESMSQGNISVLVKNTVIDMVMLEKVGLSKTQLFAQLRGQSVKHLGVIERFYMEANGSFTLVKLEQPTSGLSVLPMTDTDFEKELEHSRNQLVCDNCGKQKTPEDNQACSHCGNKSWIAPLV